MGTEEIIDAAMALPPANRVAIAERLLDSVEPDQSEIDRLWVMEVERRMEALREGRAKAVPVDEAFKGIFERAGE